MTTLQAISDQSTIDPGWVKILFAAGLAVLAITWFVIDLRRAEMKLNDALPGLLDPSVLRDRCVVHTCAERGTVRCGEFRFCKGHDIHHSLDGRERNEHS